MVMRWTALREFGPRNWISPMWLTSKRPTAVRTARCSAIRPEYSTGISQPPKSTIFAFRARWVAFRAVCLRAEAAGAGVVDMGLPRGTGCRGGELAYGPRLRFLYLY